MSYGHSCSPAPTRIEYPTSPPLAAALPEAPETAPAAPQPAMPATLEFISFVTNTLSSISERQAANNNALIERINVTSGHSYRILGDIVQILTQRRDGRSATLSSSYEAPSGASGALPPEPPEVVSGIPAGRAETPQPELTADSEQSPYVPTELDTPLDDVPASLSIEIVEADNELLPVDLGGGDDAHAGEAATAPAQAPGPVDGPLDESEAREYAIGTHEDAEASVDAAGALSQPNQAVGAEVGQADGSQEPAAPFEAPPPASDVASLSDDDSEGSVMKPQAAPDEGPIDTLVSCRSTNEFCPGTLQLIVDVGTNGVVRTGDKLFFLGDFDEAIIRLPGICTARDTQWSKLHLRTGQSEDRNGQDPMLRVLSCLRPFLRRFIGVHLVMDVDREHREKRMVVIYPNTA
ncbi:hypothetical protein EV122DRAFT_280348 [Schizophyllum commune]